MLGFLVDYAKENMATKKFVDQASKVATEIASSRMTDKQKAAATRKRLASLPEDELERLLAMAEKDK